MRIPFNDLQAQYKACREAIDGQIREVLDSSRYILGEKVEQLERELARRVGVRHAVGVGSGTQALMLALMAIGLKPGDEVITTPFTFVATAEAVVLLGGVPVFVDIEPDTFNMDPAGIEEKITPRTRAIMPVDLFGQCADYGAIGEIARRHGLAVIEDAAQAFGAQQQGRSACALGDIGCTSFYPAKPLGCYGDGGMVFTDDEETAELVRSLRVHGQGGSRYENVRIGLCARLDAIQAAVLLGKLPAFDAELQRRQQVAERYSRALRGEVVTPSVRPGNRSAWAQYCIRVPRRDEFCRALEEEGIPTAVFYPIPLHLQRAFAPLGYRPGDFPVAEAAAREVVSLPMHAYLDERTQERIIQCVRRALDGLKGRGGQ